MGKAKIKFKYITYIGSINYNKATRQLEIKFKYITYIGSIRVTDFSNLEH